MKFLWSLVLSCTCMWFIAYPCWAYNPPAGLNGSTTIADMTKPNGHGTMGLKSLDVLRGDGYGAVAAFFEPYRQQILDGEMQPDTTGNPFTISVPGVYTTPSLPGSSFSHFYNPATQKGLVIDFAQYNFVLDTAQLFSVGPWELYTLTGPQPGVNDMADWAYAEAVDAMRRGNVRQAVTKMGWVLHYIQDVTVPQHSTDEGAQKPGANHSEFENAVDTYLSTIPHATRGGIYSTTWRPGQFIEEAARRSAPVLVDSKNPARFRVAADRQVPLAEQFGAGILKRFYDKWRSENFGVVVLTIDRVRAINSGFIWNYVDYPDSADFYPKVQVDTKTYGGSSIDGGNDVYPNKLLPFSWVFPKWISNRTATVPVKIEIYDEDGVTNDDYVDVSPRTTSRALNFTYNSNGLVQGDLSVTGTAAQTVFTTQGDNSDTRASISVKMLRLPTVNPS